MPPLTVSYIKPDYDLCRNIFENQLLIWNISPGSAMPIHKLFTLADRGGIVIGAFDQNALIGHAVLIPAYDNQRHESFLYLDMVGVLPDYRNRNLAERMLRLAGEWAQQSDYVSIQWTFDPLESANANLYLKKLGARAVRFYRDYYGPATSIAYASDRFWVRWEKSTAVPAALPKHSISLQSQNPIVFPNPAQALAISLPPDFRHIIQTEPDRAAMIRLRSREVLSQVFEFGYVIAGFLRAESENYYIATPANAKLE